MTSTHSAKHILHIDLETYSSVDLAECGVYKYAESPDFEILLFGYALDNYEPVVLDRPTLDVLKEYGVVDMLLDDDYIKVAHNASFERVCISNYLFRQSKMSTGGAELPYFLPPEEWQDTMIMGSELGYPATLAMLGEAIGLPDDKQKMAVGKRLIQYFCKPCKPTKANGNRTRNYPEDDSEKWELFKSYNKRDVEAEQAIYNKLEAMGGVSAEEWANWYVDQRINDRGVGIDSKLVDAVLERGQTYTEQLVQESKQLTGLENPNSLAQLKPWVIQKEGRPIASLAKDAVKELLNGDLQPDVRRVLQIRQELGKTSVKKYDAFKRSSCKDDRVRGCFQFYGGRTGRFAGRLIQPQNFPRNSFDNIEEARQHVLAKDWSYIAEHFNSLNDVFSTLIRTAITPTRKGYCFVIADYSAIEARVTAWLVRETWRQNAFADGKDIYCASASQMFGVPVVKHGVNGHLRQKGKIAELALGYGGGVGALKAMGGEAMGLTEEEMQEIVTRWRSSSPRIVAFWKTLDKAFRNAIKGGCTTLDRDMAVYNKQGNVYIKLPNGRSIAYVNPRITDEYQVEYMGLNQTTRKWEWTGSWGGKLTENVVQAIARDCLCEVLAKLELLDFKPAMHVHDEVICEVPATSSDGTDFRQQELDWMESIMGQSPTWAQDLILTADGFYSDYYRKD